MLKEVIATGKDLNTAKENARAALGAGELDDVNFEIIDLGSRGFLGFMAKPAKVKATIEIPDVHEPRQRKERPARPERAEKVEKTADEVSSAANNENGASEERKSAPKSHNGSKKHHGAKKHETKKPASAEEAVSTAVREEVKMERREVSEGEDMSFDFVRTIISDIGLNASAELYACDDGTRRIIISGDDASTLIGHHGDTLDALQYLTNLASARKNINGERDKSRVTLDIEGYRAKREETLRALARRMAAKALRNRRSVMLEPMSAYERRIIHSEIQGIEGVSTNSVGSDSNRKIVIFLTDKKPQGIFEEDEKTTSIKSELLADSEDTTSDLQAIDQSVTSSDELDCETVLLEKTHPADEIADEDDEDIK